MTKHTLKHTLKRALIFLLAFVVLHTAANAAPADSAFLGKWKLDPAHSRLTDQMKVGSAGPNTYTLNFSGDDVETIVADGTDQPGLFGSTFAIIVQDDHHWKAVRKTNGRITIIGLWELSADGKTLTDNTFCIYYKCVDPLGRQGKNQSQISGGFAFLRDRCLGRRRRM